MAKKRQRSKSPSSKHSKDEKTEETKAPEEHNSSEEELSEEESVSVDTNDAENDNNVEEEKEEDAQQNKTDVVSKTPANDDDDDDENDDGISTENPGMMPSDGRYRNKQRCLILCSKGITSRYRHFIEDLRTLIPHHKKENKLDPAKGDSVGKSINDIAEIRSCNTVLFLECKKHRGTQDAYMWISKTDGIGGPSIKFQVTNLHTMDELKLTGNCMKGSRPILSFDKAFDKSKHLQLMKCLLIDVFNTPRGHPKSKPFIDRIMSFYYADNRIWVRNYQIVEELPSNAKEMNEIQKEKERKEGKKQKTITKTSLVEIGPRFVLNPIKVFRKSFGGQILFENKFYESPTFLRKQKMIQLGNKYDLRKKGQEARKERKEKIIIPEDPLDKVFDE